jgi:hypothetical protein
MSVGSVGATHFFFEDWGCCIPIENDASSLWVGCGNYDEYPGGFLCFIEPSKATVRKPFRKIDTSEAHRHAPHPSDGDGNIAAH